MMNEKGLKTCLSLSELITMFLVNEAIYSILSNIHEYILILFFAFLLQYLAHGFPKLRRRPNPPFNSTSSSYLGGGGAGFL